VRLSRIAKNGRPNEGKALKKRHLHWYSIRGTDQIGRTNEKDALPKASLTRFQSTLVSCRITFHGLLKVDVFLVKKK